MLYKPIVNVFKDSKIIHNGYDCHVGKYYTCYGIETKPNQHL